MIGLRLRQSCPRCSGILSLANDNDNYGDFYSCVQCGRQYGLQMQSIQMTPQELLDRTGIKLSNQELKRAERDSKRGKDVL